MSGDQPIAQHKHSAPRHLRSRLTTSQSVYINSSGNTTNQRFDTNFSYDAAGNQLTSPVCTGTGCIQYDFEERQIAYHGATAGTYAYDGDGHRVERTESGLTTVYVYDANGTLAAEYSSASTAATEPCTTCYLSTDHLGSIRMVTSQSGAIIARHDYMPFGEEIPAGYAGRPTTIGSSASPWDAADGVTQRFTGKERDSESSLDYFGARYYGSSLGRFTSPDPMLNSGRPGNPQTWNRYAYAGNNPLRNVDPTGLYFFKNTCAQGDKDCNAAFAQTQANVRKAYAATQAAYDGAVKSGDTKQAAALKRTLDGLGAEGQKNARGQTVNISASLGIDSPGNTSFQKGSTSIINIVLNPGMSSSDAGAEAAVVHEGVHADEIVPGLPTRGQAYSLEHDAYETESYFSQAIGFSNIHSPSNGSDVVNGVLDLSKDFVLWNPSWASADAATIQSHRTAGVNAAAQDGASTDCAKGGCKP